MLIIADTFLMHLSLSTVMSRQIMPMLKVFQLICALVQMVVYRHCTSLFEISIIFCVPVENAG